MTHTLQLTDEDLVILRNAMSFYEAQAEFSMNDLRRVRALQMALVAASADKKTDDLDTSIQWYQLTSQADQVGFMVLVVHGTVASSSGALIRTGDNWQAKRQEWETNGWNVWKLDRLVTKQGDPP